MQTVEKIRKLGFKRWHERALLESHGHLVTCFLGLVLAVSGIEMVGSREGAWHTLIGVTLGLTGFVLAVFSGSRYFKILSMAEHLIARAICRGCGKYAAFHLLAGGGGAGRCHRLPQYSVAMAAGQVPRLWKRVDDIARAPVRHTALSRA